MSTMALVEGPSGVVAGWETEGQIFFAAIKPGTTEIAKATAVPGAGGSRKHPAIAINASEETIVVWTEGTGWQKGGTLAWQVFDKNGRPTADKGRIERGVPVWGLPTVVAQNGGFLIIH
jgi:hypothetical protein